MAGGLSDFCDKESLRIIEIIRFLNRSMNFGGERLKKKVDINERLNVVGGRGLEPLTSSMSKPHEENS